MCHAVWSLLTMNNKLYMMMSKGAMVRDPKELTRAQIIRAASNFRWTRKGMKWTVIVGDRELPARPLVLEAAGVPPNDPTNSHQAVAILRDFGFAVRYQGKNVSDAPAEVEPHAIDELIRSLRGRYKGTPSLVEDRERDHRVEKEK